MPKYIEMAHPTIDGYTKEVDSRVKDAYLKAGWTDVVKEKTRSKKESNGSSPDDNGGGES
jgi:hypothetical protein